MTSPLSGTDRYHVTFGVMTMAHIVSTNIYCILLWRREGPDEFAVGYDDEGRTGSCHMARMVGGLSS